MTIGDEEIPSPPKHASKKNFGPSGINEGEPDRYGKFGKRPNQNMRNLKVDGGNAPSFAGSQQQYKSVVNQGITQARFDRDAIQMKKQMRIKNLAEALVNNPLHHS
jgi:hypothetical protein